MKTLLVALSAVLIVTSTHAAPVPFTLENGLITVPVEVGGKELPLMLDLGDFRAISLTSAVLDTVPVEFTGEHDIFTNYLGDPLKARRFIARDVALGDTRHANMQGSEDVFDPNNPSPNPYGAIGRAFFGNERLTIDYKAGTITVGGDPLADGVRLPLDLSGGMMRVEAHVGGKTLKLLVDTGSQVSIVSPNRFEENTRFQDSYSAYEAESLVIDGHDLGSVVLLRMDLGVPDFDGILGQDVLGRYRVQVDLQEGCLRLGE